MKRQNKTILIAEDDPNDQMLIRRAFKKIEVTDRLHIVPNGLEAIAYLNGQGKYSDRQCFEFPSMVITDLKMPLANGFAVLQHIQKNPQWVVIPTVVLSASADTDDIKKSYLAGATAYLVKPSTTAELQSLIRKFYEFWIDVEVPQINPGGDMKPTDSEGKLGEEIS